MATTIAEMKQALINSGTVSREDIEKSNEIQIKSRYDTVCINLTSAISGEDNRNAMLRNKIEKQEQARRKFEAELEQHKIKINNYLKNGEYLSAIKEIIFNTPKDPNLICGFAPDVSIGGFSCFKQLYKLLKNPKQLLKLAKSARKQAIKSYDELSAFLKSKISNMKLNSKSFKGKKTNTNVPYISSKKAAELSQSYNETGIIYYDKKIVDGFRDGGRSTRLDKWGKPINANREIITIDREIDQYLTNAINYAKNATKNMNEEQKVKFIYNMIIKISGNVEKSLAKSDEMAKQYCNSEILLGDIFENGAACCRHKALMFKILSDEIGLNAKIIRGVSADAFGKGGHVWNEIKLSNGKKFLIDTQNNHFIDLAKPSNNDKNILKSYFYQGTNPY